MAQNYGNIWKNTNRDSILYQNGDFQQMLKKKKQKTWNPFYQDKSQISTFLFTKIVNLFILFLKSPKNKNKG